MQRVEGVLARSNVRRIIAGAGVAGLVVSGLLFARPAGAAPAALTPTTTAVTAGPAVAGVATTLTATVSPKPNAGTVAFTAGGSTIYGCSAVAVNTGTGKAACTTTFSSAGSTSIVGKYSGTSTFAAAQGSLTLTVGPRTPLFGGSTSGCTTTTGAVVAVDYGPWSGPIVLGCDPSPTTGINLLHVGGFTTVGTQHDGPGFICRLGHAAFNSGTQYPTPAQDACVVTPPAAAYWSYWLALPGQTTWHYSPLGAFSDHPTAGELEAWVYGGTDIGGTTGQPTFTPAQVRAREATPHRAPARAATATPAASADLDAAVHYLTTAQNDVADGTTLAADGYYNSFTDFADFGLTIDGAFALAATGKDDATLAKVAAFLDGQQKDPSGNSVISWTGIGTDFAGGGPIGKAALLAEVTGYNPRNFAGHDLIDALTGTICAGTDSQTGCAGKGNYAYATSTFSQALGVIAQLRAGDTATDPIDYLEGLQNDSGAWPSLIPNSGDSDVDSTGMAAMALALLANDPKASAAVAKATAWIASKQLPDGGFPGTAGNSTNSVALAIQGLTLAGTQYAEQITKAKAFLAGQQNSDGGFNVAADGQPGSNVRASTQVVAGLVGTSLGTLSRPIAPAAQADTGAATKYLVGQLVDGTHLNFPESTTPNFGGTADLAMALAATGTQDAVLTKVVTYLRAYVADYADPAGKTPGAPGPYSGAAAKLALLAEITGQDPKAFGGFNLLATLTSHVCTAPDTKGACTAAGDFYQGFSHTSQAFGVLALARGGVTPPAATVTRLEQLQCPDGGFAGDLPAGPTCSSDVDTTGYAVQALALVPAGHDVVAKAVQFLLGAQQTDGGYISDAGKNSNSTALAIQALLATGAAPIANQLRVAAATPTDAVRSGQAWIASAQTLGGGIGINFAGPAEVLATSQSVPALVNATLTSLKHAVTLAPFPTGSGAGAHHGGTSTPLASPHGGGSGSLANTGAAALTWLGWAIALIAIGGGLMVVSRRSSRLTFWRRH